MKRIMLYILAFLAYGIIIARYAYEIWYIPALMIVPVFICVLLYLRFKEKRAFSFVLFSILGIILTFKVGGSIKGEVLSATENDKEIKVEATVKYRKETKNNKPFYIIKADKFIIDNKEINNRLNLIYYPKENEKLLLTSEKIVVVGRLSKIKENTNPYGFNAYNYYSARKIYMTLYGYTEESYGVIHNINFYLAYLRDKLGTIYDEILPERYSAIAKAMILGDKYELEEDLTDNFKLCGIYHILAISGLHISVIAGFLVFWFDKINVRFGKIGVIFLLILYAMLTGGSPSVVRAVIMCSVVLFRFIIKRDEDFLTSIAIACFLILCYSPMMLFDVGFQYSFGAVFTIGFIVMPAIELYKRAKGENYIVNLAITCVIISIFLKPITAYNFFIVSNVDVFINIIILPLISIGVVAALLGGVFGLISLGLGKFFIGIFYVIFYFIDKLSGFLVKLPYSYILMGRPSALVLVDFGIFAVLIGFSLYRGRKLLEQRFKFLLIGLAVFSISAAIDLGIRYNKSLEVTFLDIGQGDSVYGEYEKFNFIIDGGGSYLKEEGNDTGINVLLPHIMGKGRARVNAVFISHWDTDHIKGIIEIMDYVKIDNIFVSYKEENSEYYQKLLKKAYDKNIKISKMKNGDFIDYKALSFKCLYPYESIEEGSNNSSMLLKARLGDRSFLFTGDIEKEGEEIVLNNKEDIKADVLKVAHHGSDTSTTNEFLLAVKPKLAVISVGEKNIYNHPSKTVVKRIEENDVKLYNTSKDGAITITTNGKKIKVHKTRERSGRLE